jgi:hypothetical protein
MEAVQLEVVGSDSLWSRLLLCGAVNSTATTATTASQRATEQVSKSASNMFKNQGFSYISCLPDSSYSFLFRRT